MRSIKQILCLMAICLPVMSTTSCSEDDENETTNVSNSLTCSDSHHPHAINLGLPSGTKWCCMNVGASSPEGCGGFYAWGETSEKNVYSWDTYMYDGQYSDIAGTSYDVAHVRMGAPWRMPNRAQLSELINYCTSTWTKQNGMSGWLVTGKNGGRIFFPATGYRWHEGHYHIDETSFFHSSDNGYNTSCLGAGIDWVWYHDDDYSYYGYSVRAVCP